MLKYFFIQLMSASNRYFLIKCQDADIKCWERCSVLNYIFALPQLAQTKIITQISIVYDVLCDFIKFFRSTIDNTSMT